MERDCNKCVHHISGSCDAWECHMETLEDYRGKVIDEFAEKMKWEYRESIGTSEREIHFALAVIDQVAERLKGVQE